MTVFATAKRVVTASVWIAVTGIVLVAASHLIDLRLDHPPKAPVEPAKLFAASNVNSNIPLDTLSSLWERADWDTIYLFPQSARSPHGHSERILRAKAIYNGKDIAFFLQFNDGREDRNLPSNPDACAILFAPGDSPATVQMMGYAGRANVWQWLADMDAQRYEKGNETVRPVRELIAFGPGTQTPFEKQNVQGRGFYSNGRWSVIMKRPLKGNQEGELDFQPGHDQFIAFALWDGSRMESFSRKSISILRTLTLKEG